MRVLLLHYPKINPDLGRLVRDLVAGCELPVPRVEDSLLSGHRYVVEERLRQACDFENVDWLITVGGTWPAIGPSQNEILPQATASVLERPLPGISAGLRAAVAERNPLALLDSGTAGVRGTTFLLNLPADADLITAYFRILTPVSSRLHECLQPHSDEEEPRSTFRAGGAELSHGEFARFLKRAGSEKD